jgi:hypothetical protein
LHIIVVVVGAIAITGDSDLEVVVMIRLWFVE